MGQVYESLSGGFPQSNSMFSHLCPAVLKKYTEPVSSLDPGLGLQLKEPQVKGPALCCCQFFCKFFLRASPVVLGM
jgi:hypothetical protein